jgi:formylglycine-generating enzyme required for sulfatase activity
VSDPNPVSDRVAIPETVQISGGAIGGAPIAPFLLGRTPVTNREYAFLIATGRVAAPPWSEDPNFREPGQPVVGVTWDDAMAYARWLAERVGGRWRLPTEAEWELAACGGLSCPRTAWGETVPRGEIPDGALSGPWEAGRGTPNGFGLCDMGTIVHEWCANWAAPTRPGAPGRRASRGGSWRHEIRWSSPSAQSSLPPDFRYSDYGFRVLREAEE